MTNPPLDAIREELVTCMARIMGPERNLLAPGPASCRHLKLPYPVIDNDELAKLIHINDDGDLPGFACSVLSGLYEVDGGARGAGRRRSSASGARRPRRSRPARARSCCPTATPTTGWRRSRRCCWSPRCTTTWSAPRNACASRWSSRSGDAREVHHIALLLGYGAAAVNPYLAFETIEDMIGQGAVTGIEPAQGDPATTCRRWSRAS